MRTGPSRPSSTREPVRRIPGPDDPLRIAYPHLPWQAARRWTGRLHPSPDQGAGRPRPPRRGPVGPALPHRRRAGAARSSCPASTSTTTTSRCGCRASGSSRPGWTSPRSRRSRAGTFPEPLAFSLRAWDHLAPAGRTSSTWSRTTSAWATACSPWSASGLPVLGTIHHPITVDRRIEMEHAETPRPAVVQGPLVRVHQDADPGGQATAPGHHRVAELLRRHLPRPTWCRPSGCTSCPSASTPSCSGRSPGVQPRPEPDHLDRVGRRGDEGPALPARGAGQAAHRVPRAQARPDRPPQGGLGRAAHHRAARPARTPSSSSPASPTSASSSSTTSRPAPSSPRSTRGSRCPPSRR